MSPQELYRVERSRYSLKIESLIAEARARLDHEAPQLRYLLDKKAQDAAYYAKNKARIDARKRERLASARRAVGGR